MKTNTTSTDNTPSSAVAFNIFRTHSRLDATVGTLSVDGIYSVFGLPKGAELSSLEREEMSQFYDVARRSVAKCSHPSQWLNGNLSSPAHEL